MMKKYARIFAFVLAAGAISPVRAEVAGPMSFGFNLNFPVPAGETTDVLKNGLGFGFDLAYRKESSPLGLRLDVLYANWALTSDVLQNIRGADSGYASTWGFDLSLLLTPPNADSVRPYIQFGPGMYYQQAEASRFSSGGGCYYDPWWGTTCINNEQTVADWNTWRMGWMGGAGLDIAVGPDGSFILQMQYHMIDNVDRKIEFVPLGLGYRHYF